MLLLPYYLIYNNNIHLLYILLFHAPIRLSLAELSQVMLNELRKLDEILNYELELSEIEQEHNIQSASNIIELFNSKKEVKKS